MAEKPILITPEGKKIMTLSGAQPLAGTGFIRGSKKGKPKSK
jgi:hypothetical protein